MKLGVAEERGIGGFIILPFYGPMMLGVRPISFMTLSKLCFYDTKTNKSKTTTTMMTDNFDCDHDTVREGVK